ncbi:MAG: immunoglobulin domain-containing protein [Bacteroidaceae bacterium]|nr:immunoglobulin domain-containing protein [Bacteroidaceae bacterium]
MKKNLLTLFLAGSTLVAFAGSKVTYTTDVTRDVAKAETTPTTVRLSTNVLVEAFDLTTEGNFHKALADGTVKFLAKEGKGTATNGAVSYGSHGYWFTAASYRCNSTSVNRRVACKYEDGYFHLIHNTALTKSGLAYVNTGDQYSFTTLFVQGADTVQYVFNVTIGSAESVQTDQPAYVFIGRPSETDRWALQPLMRQNEGEWLAQNYIQVMEGDQITFNCGEKDGNTLVNFRVKDQNGTKLCDYTKKPYVLTENATPDHTGYYYCELIYKSDSKTYVQTNLRIYVDVQTQPLGTPWDWTGEVPQLSYDFHDEYGSIPAPTKVHTIKKKNGQPANQYVGKWWSVFWGDDLNSAVGGQEKALEAAKNMVAKYDTDFEYIYDNIGWPPNLSARNGYRSFIYIFGSGLANDNEPKTTEGGYQSATQTGEGYYACVWASFLPFSRFRSDADQLWSDGNYQREAMVHEGIHTLFADLNACQGSSWFHEGGNVWLQQELHVRRDNSYETTPGFLGAGNVLCPFMPIECYSGWLQDGSFGGPAAQGVNMYNEQGQQVCTWRNLIGGVQYSDVFPVVFSSVCGPKSVAWIWRHTENRVLETIAGEIGDEAMRNFITQYRARLALYDLGGWDNGYRQLADNHFGTTVKEEFEPYWIKCEPFRLTPYQAVERNSSDGWMAPDTLTNPGWSGANIIPIHVKSGATHAEVEFRPEDTHMRALLCYRTASGQCHYSQPVTCGTMRIDLTDQPANGVIFCVPLNTDYEFRGGNYGEALRKHHYDYRIRLGENALAVADTHQRWYFYERAITDPTYDEEAIVTSIQSIPDADTTPSNPAVEAPGIYSLSGQKLDCMQRGVNIVRYADGTVRKIYMK